MENLYLRHQSASKHSTESESVITVIKQNPYHCELEKLITMRFVVTTVSITIIHFSGSIQ